MCIAIVKPAEVKIRKKILRHCFDQNPDGAGFSLPSLSGNSVIIKKGFFRFREFWQNYREYEARNTPMLIHFRIATSGKTNGMNCHPWRLDDKHALVHNGVLENKLGLSNEKISDTGIFVANVLSPLIQEKSDIWLKPHFKWVVSESIGGLNKIAVIDNRGEFNIFNEEKGEWFEGAWFSNTSYKEARKRRTTHVFNNTCGYSDYGVYSVSNSSSLPKLSIDKIRLPIFKEKDVVNKESPFSKKKAANPEKTTTKNSNHTQRDLTLIG